MNKLLFLHIEGLSKYRPISLNLSNEFDISIDRDDNLQIQRSTNHLKPLLGENIFDINVLAGENGTGKSKLLRIIAEIISGSRANDGKEYKYLAVISEEQNKISIVNHLDRPIQYDKNSGYFDITERGPGNSLVERQVIYYSPYLDFNLLDFPTSQLKFPVQDISQTQLMIRDAEIHQWKQGGQESILAHKFENANRQLRFLVRAKDNVFKLPFDEPKSVDIFVNRLQVKTDDLSIEARSIYNVLTESLNEHLKDAKKMHLKKIEAKVIFLRNLLSAYFAAVNNDRIKSTLGFMYEKKLVQSIANLHKPKPTQVIKLVEDFFKEEDFFRLDIFSRLASLVFDIIDSIKNQSMLEMDDERLMMRMEVHSPFVDAIFSYFRSEGSAKQKLIYKELYRLFNFEWQNLSSGEKSFFDLFSRLDYAKGNIKKEKRSTLVILDEAEAGFHPKWQIQYLSFLKAFFNYCFSDTDVQLLLATHSPLVLSDFPSKHVHLLKKEDGIITKQEPLGTFAQNISVLLADEFFLNKTLVGDLAREYINQLIARINNLEDAIDTTYYHEVEEAIAQIDEPIIKKLLMNQLQRSGHA